MTDAGRLGEGPGSSQYDPTTGLVVATCFWDDCDNPAPVVERFLVYPPNSSVMVEFQIPLCRQHLGVALAAGKLPPGVIRRMAG